jgi:hypothetical protein
MSTYVDLASIDQAGSRVSMWSMVDLRVARRDNTGRLFMSTKLHREYDCKERQSRNLYFSFHTGNMTTGEMNYVGADPENWAPIPPGSITENLLNIACKKQ